MSSVLSHDEDTRIGKGIKSALEEDFPVTSENGRVKLRLDEVYVDDSEDPLEENPNYVNEARSQAKSYELPIKGRFRVEKDGETVDTHETEIGPYFPIVENLGTRIIDGKHYQNKYQVRREPGVYPFKTSGGEAKVEFNAQQGGSFNFVVDAKGTDTPTLDVQVIGENRKKIPRGVYGLLKIFGVSESEIQEIMGDLYKYNHQDLNVGQDPSQAGDVDLENIAKRLFTGIAPSRVQNEFDAESASFDEIASVLRDFLTDGEAFNANVNKETIDTEIDTYSPEAIKQSARKLVRTYNGEETPSHRFSEKFRKLHGLPTQVRENIKRDTKLKRKLNGRVQDQVNQAENLMEGRGPDPNLSASKMLQSFKPKLKEKLRKTYTNSSLSTTTETNNILDIDNRGKEITIKGPGGIQSEHAIQPGNIELHPSRLGLMDIVNTPTGSPGRSMPLAKGATVGEDGEIERTLYDRKQGKERVVTAEEVDEGGIAFADEFEKETREDGSVEYVPKSKEVFAGVGDEVKEVPEEEVRYVMRDMTDMLADGTNIVPFLNHNSGPRTIMGARQMAQGVSLEDPDAPLVDTRTGDGDTFFERLGKRYNVTAKKGGTVQEVNDDSIVIADENGEETTHSLFNNLALNQGGFINHEPTVEEGDRVEEGEQMTNSNYTDDDGKMAIGKNLDVAYTPWMGLNYEDAIVMSESGAQKLTSEHVYEKVLELEDNDKVGMDVYDSYVADRGSSSDVDRSKLDSEGVIREGATVQKGDLLVPAVSISAERKNEKRTATLDKMFGKMGLDNRDRSIYWDKPFEGKVTKVENRPTEIRVFIKSKEPFKEGDKLSNRSGQKGIVSKILPDHKMPQTKDGKVPDVLIDSHGVPSRANPGQIFELAAGKIAEETGETFKTKNFEGRDDWEKIKKKMDEEGVDLKEDMVHPETGRTIPDVAIGPQYNAKLKHMLEKKFAARSMNEGYDMDKQPAGGASMDNLTVHAMIGHNARANLSEMTRLKGTKNHEYWTDLANNKSPEPAADTPYSFKKFRAMMQSLGINVEEDQNDALKLMPWTDEGIKEKSAGAIDEATQFNARKFNPRGFGAYDPFRKGLFDPNLIGENGQNWNHIELPEPVPNPLFKKGVQQTLERGLPASLDVTPKIEKADGTKKSIREIAQKDIKDLYTQDAKIHIGDETFTGGSGLKDVLSKVDLDKAEEQVREKAKNYMEGDFKPDRADEYKTALRHITNLQDAGVAPEDAYVLENVPVMPAEFRQPLVTQDGSIRYQPTNKLYAGVIGASNSLKEAIEDYLPEEDKKISREGLMQELGALMGDGSRPRGDVKARSIMDQLSGGGAMAGEQNYTDADDESKGPKGGFVQRKVMKKKQDLSGRSTIIPSGLKKYTGTDGLGIDEIGLPEEMAWNIYEPFVRQRLSRRIGGRKAKKEFEERTGRAKDVLKEEMEDRPVMMNRDPSWWQHNVTAHKPTLIEKDPESDDTEKAIRVPNMVVAPYQGGDFDGDAVSIHVPTEDEAKEEAKGLMPSRNLRAPGSKKLMVLPDHSQLLGLHDLSQVAGSSEVAKGDPEPKNFEDVSSPGDLIEKYRTGAIEDHQPVEVMGENGEKETWTPGWAMIDDAIKTGSEGAFGIKDLMDKMQGDNPERNISFESLDLDDDTTNDVLMESLMKHYPEQYADVAHKLSMVGAQHATNMGFSVGFDDIKPDDDIAERYYQNAEENIDDLAKEIAQENGRDEPVEEDRNKARVQLGMGDNIEVGDETVRGVMKGMEEEIINRPGENSLVRMMQVGSRSSPNQIRQLLGTMGMVKDVHKQRIPKPIKSSLNRGLKGGEYYLQQHGALMGLRDRSVETSKPGYLGKQIIAGAQDMVVTEKDCGTTTGKELPLRKNGSLNTKDLQGRFLANSGEEITGATLSSLDRQNKETVEVRSPLTCEAEKGVCQKSFHPKTTVMIDRPSWDNPRQMTMRALFESVDGSAEVVDGMHQKSVSETWMIRDGDGFTALNRVMWHPREQNKKVVEVQTTAGSIQVTGDHPMVISQPEDKCEECGSHHLDIDDRAPEDTVYLSCHQCRNYIGKSDLDMKEVSAVRADCLSRGDYIDFDLPNFDGSKEPNINPYFLGAFLAEGSVNSTEEYPRTVMLAQSKSSVARDAFEKAADDECFNPVNRTQDRLELNSSNLVRRIDRVVGISNCDEKALPEDWLSWDEQYIANVVAGLFDGDGSVRENEQNNEAYIGSTSYELLSQLKMWLLSRGVRVSLRNRSQGPGGNVESRREMYHLVFAINEDLQDLMSKSVKVSNVDVLHDPSPQIRNGLAKVKKVRDVDSQVQANRVYDVTTESHRLLANGLETHNCYGLTENGEMPDLGENVGVREGQGIIEASTKLTLKSFHNTGSADKTEPSFKRFQEVVQLDTPSWKAHIAEGTPGETFEVEDVNEVEAQGGTVGTDVTYRSKDTGEKKTTRVPPGRNIRDKVSPGEELESGEKITESGNYDPYELEEVAGLDTARDYLTDELHSIFDQIGGLSRRSAETTLSAMTDFARVKDGGDSEWEPGEMVPSGKIQAHNRRVEKPDEPEQRRIEAETQMTPIGKVPFLGENWLAKQNFQNLKRELKNSTIEGETAQLRDTNPVSAYMYGKNMDKGQNKDRYQY